jgi:predicted amidohydrolase YtcJ
VLLEEKYLQSELMLKRLGAPGNNWRHGMMPKETLCNLVRKYHDQGQQLIIHAQGDRAIRDVIDAYEAALKASPRDDHRHRIEHCGLFPLDEMRRAAKLGLTLSIHPNYIYYYGDAVRDEILGIERANIFMPAGAAVNSGLRISLHSDSPMFPPEPIRLLQTAVTRKNKLGEIIGSDQAIDIDAAIKAITIDAAYQLFLDQKIGSLEVGKLADLVTLSDNPRQIDPEQLYRIQVVETWREGKPYTNE